MPIVRRSRKPDATRFCDALLITLERLREDNRLSVLRPVLQKQISDEITLIEELIAKECAAQSEKKAK